MEFEWYMIWGRQLKQMNDRLVNQACSSRRERHMTKALQHLGELKCHLEDVMCIDNDCLEEVKELSKLGLLTHVFYGPTNERLEDWFLQSKEP
jgi:hypothetical protein